MQKYKRDILNAQLIDCRVLIPHQFFQSVEPQTWFRHKPLNCSDTQLRSWGNFSLPRTDLRLGQDLLCSWTTSMELFTDWRPLSCH